MVPSISAPAPVVSIITPAFNAERYIEHTLESALRQTFPEFELLVADDGSTDGTAEIARRYAERDARFRVLRQPNRGIAAARNLAMRHARGRYLALLDSDDLWFPTYLAEQVAILEGRPDIGVLSANALNFGGVKDGEPLLTVYSYGIQPVSLLRLIQVEDGMSILSVFRREVFDTIGLFDESLRRSEDYDFWLRAAFAGFNIAINPRPLGLYRRRPDSLSADEALMLEAMRRPLQKIRQACLHRADVRDAVDLQLGRIAERGLVARARHALVTNDMPGLATQFSALAAATGASRYRLARWLTGHIPLSIRLAYWCRRAGVQAFKAGRRMTVGPLRAFWAGDRA
jgi:glycosyltransferase involved in cell wall biosynthesis